MKQTNWMPVLTEKGGPAYKQLEQALLQAVSDGELSPGDRLPSVRKLAAALGIHTETVSRALAQAEAKGAVRSVRGSGVYVTEGAKGASLLKPYAAGSGIVELGSLSPAILDLAALQGSLQQAALGTDLQSLFGYVPDKGFGENLSAKEILRRLGCHAESDEILYACGGQNAIVATMLSAFKPGDRIGADPYIYPGIRSVAAMLGLELVCIGGQGPEMTEEELETAVRCGIRGLYVTPDLQNPTTHVMSQHCMDRIAALAEKEDILVLEDDIFGLAQTNRPASIADRCPNHTVFIASLSKIVSPGLRLAYVKCPQSLKSRLSETLHNIQGSVVPASLAVMEDIVREGKLDSMIAQYRSRTRVRNLYVEQYLKGCEIRGDLFDPLRWCVLPFAADGMELERRALARGVRINCAERFYIGSGQPASAFRLCPVTPTKESDLKESLLRLSSLLEELRWEAW